MLANDIRAISASAALTAIRNSDFAVLTDVSSEEGPGFVYPFNASMRAVQPQLDAAADQLMYPIGHFQAYSHSFTLYMRAPIRLEGDNGGWVTSRGITLSVGAEYLKNRRCIELTGTTFG